MYVVCLRTDRCILNLSCGVRVCRSRESVALQSSQALGNLRATGNTCFSESLSQASKNIRTSAEPRRLFFSQGVIPANGSGFATMWKEAKTSLWRPNVTPNLARIRLSSRAQYSIVAISDLFWLNINNRKVLGQDSQNLLVASCNSAIRRKYSFLGRRNVETSFSDADLNLVAQSAKLGLAAIRVHWKDSRMTNEGKRGQGHSFHLNSYGLHGLFVALNYTVFQSFTLRYSYFTLAWRSPSCWQ